MMKLSVSNIAWEAAEDGEVYGIMREYGFSALEIAPTRIFPEAPYDRCGEAAQWAGELKKKYGFEISSMQSVWYGRKENIFGSPEERQTLLEYTEKAVLFAESIGCRNIVFGCPKNRNLPEGADADSALSFFRKAGDFAAAHGTVIAMEANPTVYNTNYINTTPQAAELVRRVGSEGFRLNLDTGTMIYNGETADMIKDSAELINHVHISEPMLKKICRRELHGEITDILRGCGYSGYISAEAGRCGIADIRDIAGYLAEITG